MSMLKKLTDLATSEKGKEFAEKATAKAKQIANDPETREKIDAAKKKITERVGALGEKPAASTGGTADEPVVTSTTGATIDPDNLETPIEPDHDPNPSAGGKAA